MASANSCAMSVSVRTTSTFIGLEPHHLHTGVDEDDVAGDAASQIARQEDRGVRDLRGIGVAAERSALLDGVENGGEIFDGAGGGRLDRPGGDRIHADLLRAK